MLLGNSKINRLIVHNLVYSVIAIALTFSLISCDVLNLSGLFFRNTPIGINAIAEKKINKSVYIVGKVTKIVPFLTNSAYQIQDSTGSVWVVTAKPVPPVGEHIRIKGKIKSENISITTEEINELYLLELEQLTITLKESRNF